MLNTLSLKRREQLVRLITTSICLLIFLSFWNTLWWIIVLSSCVQTASLLLTSRTQGELKRWTQPPLMTLYQTIAYLIYLNDEPPFPVSLLEGWLKARLVFA